MGKHLLNSKSSVVLYTLNCELLSAAFKTRDSCTSISVILSRYEWNAVLKVSVTSIIDFLGAQWLHKVTSFNYVWLIMKYSDTTLFCILKKSAYITPLPVHISFCKNIIFDSFIKYQVRALFIACYRKVQILYKSLGINFKE